MPPAYVKPYFKRQKNDAADAEAICEAVSRANMRFVETKTPEQQSCLMLHRTPHLFIRQQTAVINSIRAHLAEFGMVARVGRHGVEDLLDVVADPSDTRLPGLARACLAALGAQLRMLKAQILEFDQRIMAWHRSNEISKQLDEIRGVGLALATALVARGVCTATESGRLRGHPSVPAGRMDPVDRMDRKESEPRGRDTQRRRTRLRDSHLERARNGGARPGLMRRPAAAAKPTMPLARPCPCLAPRDAGSDCSPAIAALDPSAHSRRSAVRPSLPCPEWPLRHP
jgi:hypothetical protein